ncbi:hypothetical protein D6C93_01857 [Aureobasidium pullulans]|nr:hypothetical protein D6C93_01857 [Aureobasidium pullulans]
MRSFSTITILAAIGAVGAAPAPTPYVNSARSDTNTAKAYTPVVWNTTAVVDGINIHNMPIQARDGAFKVGGDAAGVCPSYDPNCSSQNKTIISPGGNRTMWMGILDSYGQQVVAGDGQSLQYTLPKTYHDTQSGVPWGQSFDVDFDDYSNETVMRFNGDDFVACPSWGGAGITIQPLWDKAAAYKFPGCVPIKFRLVETTAPAVDYYQSNCCQPCTEYYHGPERYPVHLDKCYDAFPGGIKYGQGQ